MVYVLSIGLYIKLLFFYGNLIYILLKWYVSAHLFLFRFEIDDFADDVDIVVDELVKRNGVDRMDDNTAQPQQRRWLVMRAQWNMEDLTKCQTYLDNHHLQSDSCSFSICYL